MTSNNSIVKMPAITALLDSDFEPLNPTVARILREFLVEIKDMPGMTDEDFTSDEITKWKVIMEEIITTLIRCGREEDYLRISVSLLSLSTAMSNLRQLLKSAWGRKAENAQKAVENAKKAREEEEKIAAREEMKRRLKGALEIISPPFEKAEKLLPKWRYADFEKSIGGALRAVIGTQNGGQSKGWTDDSRAFAYLTWVEEIKKIEDEQRQRREDARQAAIAKDIAISLRTAAVQKFRDELSNHTAPVLPYPLALSGHHPDQWCMLRLPDDRAVREWAGAAIRKQIPALLTDVIRWNLDWEMKILPHASYEVNQGIPCLKWDFIALTLVTAKLELGECHVYDQHPGYAELIKGEGQQLGTVCIWGKWPCEGNFNTPIILLQSLAEGKMEVPGVMVIEVTGHATTFQVAGAESVRVDDDFRHFIKYLGKKKTPLWRSLYKMDLIEPQVSDLLGKKWNQYSPPAFQGSGLEETGIGAVVKKLVSLGLTAKDATDKAIKKGLPLGVSVDAVVKLILEEESS